MNKNDILICIFNYRHDENAKRLLNIFGKHFKTRVLDSGNDHEEKMFIQFPNIYYSGLVNETKKLVNKSKCKYVGIICSDVEISDNDAKIFIDKIKNLDNTDYGIFQPGLTKETPKIWWYKSSYEEDNKKFSVSFIDGFCYIIKRDVFDELPEIDTHQNKYGYGIDIYLATKSLEKGYKNVIDTSSRIYHPSDKGYDDAQAHKQGDEFLIKLTDNNLMYYVQKYNFDIMKNIKEDFNIVWYVLCWNEMPILPFMIDYWKQIARKVVVYDNNSTDGTLDYLKAFDWIEVRPYPISTNNQLNDEINYKIKNDCWKEQKGKGVDFVLVSDLDEVIWSKNLYNELKYYKDSNIAIVKPQAYDFVSLVYPIHGDLLLHEQIKTCYRFPWWDKCILFSPDRVDEINYSEGAHSCKPVYNSSKYSILHTGSLFLFHFKYLSLEYLIMKRYATRGRISDINKEKGWGTEYSFVKEQIIEQFFERWTWAKNNSVDNILK